jgi:uncharacterized protein (TIGR02118 family)
MTPGPKARHNEETVISMVESRIMMKSVCTLARRNDFTRDMFRDYYENNHSTLAIQYFPFRRYVRNHVVESPDAGFDTISEFWSDDGETAAALMNGPVGDIMRADEQRFMDRSRIAPAGADEHILADGALTDPDGYRFAILLDWIPQEPAIEAELLDWAAGFGKSAPGVSLDLTTSWTATAFPGRAILWTPNATLPERQPSWLRSKTVKVRRFETPQDKLLKARN